MVARSCIICMLFWVLSHLQNTCTRYYLWAAILLLSYKYTTGASRAGPVAPVMVAVIHFTSFHSKKLQIMSAWWMISFVREQLCGQGRVHPNSTGMELSKLLAHKNLPDLPDEPINSLHHLRLWQNSSKWKPFPSKEWNYGQEIA